MKISMWMIIENLKKYRPEYTIEDGSAHIIGLRLISSESEFSLDSKYVYLKFDKNTPGKKTAVMRNGKDTILLQCSDTTEVLNDILAIFDFYNTWERSLLEASIKKNIQKIIDIGDSVLKNPMMVVDINGKVLAMSSSYRNDDINDYWIESRNTGYIPAAVLGIPLRTIDGRQSSWTDIPQIYFMPDNTKIIGAFINAGGSFIAGIGLWEYKKPILPSDVWLVHILCNVLSSIIETQKNVDVKRTATAILADLLSGVQIERELLDGLELNCPRPWHLLLMDTPYRNSTISRRSLAQRLQMLPQPCVSLVYENYVVALVSQNQTENIIHQILGKKEQIYYRICISLPFDTLSLLSARYNQALFVLTCAEKTPGQYMSEDYMLSYLLRSLSEENKRQNLIHPALGILKKYDFEKKSDLYNTLYTYLQNERSIIQSSQELHIHKNTLIYRLQRIDALANLNLSSPDVRLYLLLSYLLEKN